MKNYCETSLLVTLATKYLTQKILIKFNHTCVITFTQFDAEWLYVYKIQTFFGFAQAEMQKNKKKTFFTFLITFIVLYVLFVILLLFKHYILMMYNYEVLFTFSVVFWNNNRLIICCCTERNIFFSLKRAKWKSQKRSINVSTLTLLSVAAIC